MDPGLANTLPAKLCHQRDCQCIGFAQCMDDVLLVVLADRSLYDEGTSYN